MADENQQGQRQWPSLADAIEDLRAAPVGTGVGAKTFANIMQVLLTVLRHHHEGIEQRDERITEQDQQIILQNDRMDALEARIYELEHATDNVS
jgi:hypothetical protein